MTTAPSPDPRHGPCEICGRHAVLTGPGHLFALAVRPENRPTVTHWICDECVGLFRPGKWRKTRKVLRTLKGFVR